MWSSLDCAIGNIENTQALAPRQDSRRVPREPGSFVSKCMTRIKNLGHGQTTSNGLPEEK